MKLNENKYKYSANIETYINGKTLKEAGLTYPPGGNAHYVYKRGDVNTYRVSKKENGEFIGLSESFNTKLEAWDYLVQFEEGKI